MALYGNVVKICTNAVRNIISQSTSVRFRWHQTHKVERGKVYFRRGYDDRIYKGGLLPRVKGGEPLPIPEYHPKNVWTDKRATFGQNDYVDILGNANIRPAYIQYNIPPWLRGFRGDEYEVLLRKRKALARTKYPLALPLKWEHLEKRIRYLYRYINMHKRAYLRHTKV